MSPSPPILRFAPSPTGLLHIGNLRTALLNWLFARREGGEMILRLDDTDASRCEERFVAGIREDLAWVGVTTGREVRQSERMELYNAAFERLRKEGRVYPCYETAEELKRKQRMLRERGGGVAPIYDRAALRLSEGERTALEAEGRKPHWRFRLEREVVEWEDMICGAQRISTASLSDPVVRREDGMYLYTLPSVVDDMEMGVSHVIRGADHITNTAVQLSLFAALGGKTPPRFGHHSLLLAEDGEKLSKRLEGLSLASLRGDGFEPLAMTCLLARLGSCENPRLADSMDALAGEFSLDIFSRAAARFDVGSLESLNARLLHEMEWEQARPRLEALGVGGGAAFWHAVRRNLTRFAQAREWWLRVSEPMEPVIDSAEDAAMLGRARECLPPPPWSGESYRQWVRAAGEATGRRGRTLFMPLRLALTGEKQGPALEALLPLMGYERVAARLGGERA